jgi:hypothetical protein
VKRFTNADGATTAISRFVPLPMIFAVTGIVRL